MYKLIRPLLFRLQPETIHHLIVSGLRALHYIPLARTVMRWLFVRRRPELEREVLGLRFPNPIGMAAGFDKDAEVYDMLGALGFGFVEIGTVTPMGQNGNPKPRCFRLPEDGALINRMGFNNQGVQKAMERLRKRKPGRQIIGGNIGKNTLTPNEQASVDYLKAFRTLYDYVDYFVVNVSCPNITGLSSLQNRSSTTAILESLKEFRQGQADYRPILLKISPDLTPGQVDDMIEVAQQCKIDGIVATNTTTGREGLRTPPERLSAIGRGGLSGKPLTERSREMVRYVHQKTGGRRKEAARMLFISERTLYRKIKELGIEI